MIIRDSMKVLLFTISILALSVFIAGCERDVFTEPKEDITKYYRTVIKISSSPSDSHIYFNGRNTGYKTPALVVAEEPGTQTFTLKKENFYDTSFTFYLTPLRNDSINIDFSNKIKHAP